MQGSRDICGWLVSDQGRVALARAEEMAGNALQRATALRREFSVEQATAIVEQLELRERAGMKFLHAEKLFFTRVGLEQATDGLVAAYKSQRFRGQSRVADLCCGIGGDLMAMASQASATGLDRDAVSGIFAGANLQTLGLPGTVDVTELNPETLNVDAWHIDPDRRPGGKRSVHLEMHEPGLETLEKLLQRVPNGAIKLAPAAEPPEEWKQRAEWEWISRGGECKQLVTWFGALARSPGQVRATILARSLETPVENAVLATFVGERGRISPLSGKLSRYLYEPDAAVLAADLSGDLAEHFELEAVAPGIAYFTGDRVISDAALTGFEILDEMPFREPALKTWLADRRIGRLEIKKRGIEIDPESLRKRLKLKGDESATLLLYSHGDKKIAVLARRLSTSVQA